MLYKAVISRIPVEKYVHHLQVRDDLLIDNSNTSLELSANSIRSSTGFVFKLDIKMGWIMVEHEKILTKT